MINLVGIDLSLDSTAISVLRNDEIILCSFTTMKRNNGWIKKTMNYIDYEFINYTYKDIDVYSQKEIMKLREYDIITDKIFNKVFGNIDKTCPTIIAIEGYNYGLKNTSSIIDIVTFSTLIRSKLYNGIPDLEGMVIVSPKSVKSMMCSLAYGKTIVEKIDKMGNKKTISTINKNENGVSGGNFDKKDIMLAFFEMDINNKLKEMLNIYKEDLLKLKNVPKPIDDILDSFSILLMLQTR